MPTGERTTRAVCHRAACHRAVCQAGFTYLVLLLAIAIGAAGLAALGTQWRTKLQRDRETELLFRGREIGAAIQAYRAAVPGLKQWPTRFEDLLEDRRQGDLRRHLRRLYTDPFTGQADWVLTATEDGGFRGVRSRSEAPAYITRAFNDELAALDAAAAQRRVSEHFFGVSASAAAPSASASRSPNPPHPPNSARP